MNTQNTDLKTIIVFKLTNEDWHYSYRLEGYYENITDRLLRVMFFKLSSSNDEPPIWRTCVWGNDDFGMEYDSATKEDTFAKFMQIISMEFISKTALEELGFVRA